jgi:hypothetical protein
VDTEDVRLAVYRSFVATGDAPAVEALADELGATPTAVREALTALHQARHLVLDGGGTGDRIVMAHPFTSVPLGFSVMGARTLWWGGCAWDAFATPHLLPHEDEVLVATTCPACGAAHAWVVGTTAPPAGDQRAHFLVPASRMWDDVVHTCAHQRLFCDDSCIAAWLERTGNERGYVMDLATLWRFAAHWYDGRLTRGYVRREPDAARDYFASVGLTGPFWGLPDPPT